VENFQSNSDFKLGNPENNPILDRFAGVASARGGEAAVFHPDGTVARTFRQIQEGAGRWAEELRAFSGRVVGIQAGNTPAWGEVLLGAWMAGCGVAPMDPELAVERATGTGRAPADLLKLTSGTTGDPRAIRFTAGQLLADCDTICDTMGLTEADVNYGVITFAHSYGFSNLVTPLLCRGIPLVAAEDAIPRAIASGLAATGATVLPGVPAHFRTLAQLPPPSGRLRLCISAGARLATGTAEAFHRAWSLKVHSFYGASECGGICYDAGDHPDVPEGFVGAPMARVSLEPLDSGSMQVRSHAVGLGYLPDEPGDLAGGAFRPADLLEKWQGGYVITGRTSDLINVAGRKVNPAEIESVVRRCPGISDAVVLGLPAGLRGEEVAACVVGDAGEDLLRRFCGEHLAAWQVPRRWIFLPEIPVNARGKISRSDLRRRIEG